MRSKASSRAGGKGRRGGGLSDQVDGGRRRSHGRGQGRGHLSGPEDDPGNPNLYTEVDRFHMEKDKITFGEEGSNDDDSDESEQEEAVMGLGDGDSDDGYDDSEDDDEEDDSDDSGNLDFPELPEHVRRAAMDGASSSSDDSDGENARGHNRPFTEGWGKGRSAYYDADTADLEIGQEFDDAEAEEEAALELQKASYAHLEDADFGEEEEESKGRLKKGKEDPTNKQNSDKDELSAMKVDLEQIALGTGGQVETAVVKRNTSRLKKQDKLALVISESPELPTLLRELQTCLTALTGTVQPLLDNITKELGASEDGLSYLRTRQQLLMAYCINVCFYMLLKAKGQPSKGHPVVERLLSYRGLLEEMVPIDKAVESQTVLLVRALAAGIDLAGVDDEGLNEEEEPKGSRKHGEDRGKEEDGGVREDDGSGSKSVELDEEGLEEEELRFMGGGGVVGEENKKSRKKGKKAEAVAKVGEETWGHGEGLDDFGDMEEETQGRRRGSKKVMMAAPGANLLQGMVNRISQREQSAVSRKGKGLHGDVDVPVRVKDKTIRVRRPAPGEGDDEEEDGFDYGDDGDDDIGLGLGGGFMSGLPAEVLEAMASEGRGKRKGKARSGKRGRDDVEMVEGEVGNEGNQVDASEAYYAAVAADKASKKKTRESKYKPTPFVAGTLEEELEEERLKRGGEDTTGAKRGASYAIMKNRGLTPHKNKLNRNPRAKKREAFRKAKIRRKGQVREIRTGEADSYGGEATGIKSGIIRSRKLTG
ncbi:unnamed protein product [Choristocarpus tenellus]